MPEPWMVDAACRDAAIPTFFPDRAEAAGQARAICNDCPVRAECLDWSMTPDAPRYGILAGLTARERSRRRD